MLLDIAAHPLRASKSLGTIKHKIGGAAERQMSVVVPKKSVPVGYDIFTASMNRHFASGK